MFGVCSHAEGRYPPASRPTRASRSRGSPPPPDRLNALATSRGSRPTRTGPTLPSRLRARSSCIWARRRTVISERRLLRRSRYSASFAASTPAPQTGLALGLRGAHRRRAARWRPGCSRTASAGSRSRRTRAAGAGGHCRPWSADAAGSGVPGIAPSVTATRSSSAARATTAASPGHSGQLLGPLSPAAEPRTRLPRAYRATQRFWLCYANKSLCRAGVQVGRSGAGLGMDQVWNVGSPILRARHTQAWPPPRRCP